MSTPWDGNQAHDHEEWDALAVGYALSALEPSELDVFLQHLLSHCADCSRAVADTEIVGAELGAAVHVDPPSDQLRDSVLAAAFQARPAVPQTTAGLDQAVSLPAPADLAGARERRRSRHTSSGQGRRTGRSNLLLVAAALIVALAVSVSTFSVLDRNHAHSVADSRSAAISALLAGGNGQLVELTDKQDEVMATVVARPDAVDVVSTKMPKNSSATSYVLWGISGNGSATPPVALGVFDVTHTGLLSAQVGADSRGDYTAFKGFAISQEPGNVPPKTPSDVLATGNA